MNKISQPYILIVPDSFKGSLTSVQAANAIKTGFCRAGLVNCMCLPIADGGEGTVDAMISSTDGKLISKQVRGPMGDEVDSFYGILGDTKTAVMEMAAASGLTLVERGKNNPLLSSTYGTGQLMTDAADRGCDKIIIGIGGSATVDGGCGMARALGVKFLDRNGDELEEGGGALINLAHIDISGLDKRFSGIDIKVACDVSNVFTGRNGAAMIYAPQKGANENMTLLLDEALLNLSDVIKNDLGININDLPGSGAAGGLGGGLRAFVNAKLMSGTKIIFEAINIENHLKRADFVITGEGKTDNQTLNGKVPFAIAEISSKYNKPLICISGSLGIGYEKLFDVGITSFFTICRKPMTLDYAIQNAYSLLCDTAENIARLININY